MIIILMFLVSFSYGFLQAQDTIVIEGYVMAPLLRNSDAPEFVRYTLSSYIYSHSDYFILNEEEFVNALEIDTIMAPGYRTMIENSIVEDWGMEEFGLYGIPYVDSYGISNLLKLDISPIVKIGNCYFVYNKVRIRCKQDSIKSHGFFGDNNWHDVLVYSELLSILPITHPIILLKSFYKDNLNDYVFKINKEDPIEVSYNPPLQTLEDIYVMVPLTENNGDNDYLRYCSNYFLETNGEVLFFSKSELCQIIKADSISVQHNEILLDPAIGLFDFDLLKLNPNLKLTFSSGVVRALLLDNSYVIEIRDTFYSISKVSLLYESVELFIPNELTDNKKRIMKVVRWLKSINPFDTEIVNLKGLNLRIRFCNPDVIDHN